MNRKLEKVKVNQGKFIIYLRPAFIDNLTPIDCQSVANLVPRNYVISKLNWTTQQIQYPSFNPQKYGYYQINKLDTEIPKGKYLISNKRFICKSMIELLWV